VRAQRRQPSVRLRAVLAKAVGPAAAGDPHHRGFAQDTLELLARLTDDAPAALRGEFRARERILGVTLDARHSMRICYVAPCTDDGSPELVVSLDSYRDL